MPKVIQDASVFKAAIKIFAARGYDSTTTKTIAAAADIDESTLFRKYGNKTSLLTLAFNHQFSNVPLSNLIYTGNLEADLESIVLAYVETTEKSGAAFPMLLSEIPRNPELRPALDSILTNIQGISKIIQQYQVQGLLTGNSPLECIAILFGPLMTSQLFENANLPVPTFDVKEYVAGYLYGRKG